MLTWRERGLPLLCVCVFSCDFNAQVLQRGAAERDSLGHPGGHQGEAGGPQHRHQLDPSRPVAAAAASMRANRVVVPTQCHPSLCLSTVFKKYSLLYERHSEKRFIFSRDPMLRPSPPRPASRVSLLHQRLPSQPVFQKSFLTFQFFIP